MNRRTIIALALVIVLVALALLLGPCVLTATPPDPPDEPAGSSHEPQDPDGGSTN